MKLVLVGIGMRYNSLEAFRPPKKLPISTRLQATTLIPGKSILRPLATVATPPSPSATPKSHLATPPSHRLTQDPQSLSLPRSLPMTLS